MPTRKHLKDEIDAARKDRGAASHTLSQVKKLDLPKQARKPGKKLRRSLKHLIAKLTKRIPKLKARLEKLASGSGPKKAVNWAEDQVGVTENPSGSNWGHPVQDWIQRTGYSGPVPWCGCFVHEAVVEVAGANVTVGLGYAPNIVNAAHAGTGGLRAVSSPDKGDIGSLWNGEHVVLIRGPIVNGQVPTVEGNTSPSSAGSQYNGGCVALKYRAASDFDVFARPDW